VKPIYMLAFDHRASFSRDLLGIQGEPTTTEALAVSEAKRVIYDGFELALAGGVPRESAGLLVDEQYGAEIARAAREAGVVLAMPVEKSGQAEFEPEFGAQFAAHIEAFDPTYAKVLVRYNPEGDRAANERQADRLRALSDWLRAHDRKLLFELLVPAEAHQLEAFGRDRELFDRALRPDLVAETIRELQDAGVEPHIWKIEGLDRRDDNVRVAAQARRDGRDEVGVIVLGRGADEARVLHWLEQAAGVAGFVGFAVGRTLWWNELVSYVAGDISRREAAAQIAANYVRMVRAYEAGSTPLVLAA
jgi:myo-inositol catabolism protein IolC